MIEHGAKLIEGGNKPGRDPLDAPAFNLSGIRPKSGFCEHGTGFAPVKFLSIFRCSIRAARGTRHLSSAGDEFPSP